MTHEGWQGWTTAASDLACEWLAAAARGGGRASRHARTLRVGDAWVKVYPEPEGRRARRAVRMGAALAAAGFGVPTVRLAVWRGGEAVVVTDDVGGCDVATAVGACAGRAKRALLQQLGAEVARLHAAGFVHGDLVPPNVFVAGARFVLLDHDRTRRSRCLVRVAGRRNLVQLGRFVVPGVRLADRARVLAAYAAARGLSRRRRHRLAWWVVDKTTARRCAIDRIAPEAVRRAGYRALMRSGGPFDAAAVADGVRS